MKSWWIFVVLALLLLAWGFRESFTSYEDALKDVGQTSGYLSLTPVCPVGSVINAEKTKCKFTDTTKLDVVPTCSSETLELVGGVCRRKSGPMGGTTTGTGNSSGATGGTTSGTTTGTTAGVTAGATGGTTSSGTTTPATQSSTGGSSTSSYGPNSGGSSGNMKGIFGPTFTGIGEGGNVPSTDSSTTNQYPELLGGGGSEANAKKNGAGFGIGIGSLTGGNLGGMGGGMGGTSRQPGDMDVIPDPFRVSQLFSASNYSFKTDPMPFLTDFSAFSK